MAYRVDVIVAIIVMQIMVSSANFVPQTTDQTSEPLVRIPIKLPDLPLTYYTPNPLVQILISGFLDCSLPPNQPVRSPPIAGTNVIYQCGPDRATVADAVTDAAGAFTLILKNVHTTLFDLTRQCRVVVRLPIARCEALPPSGTLQAAAQTLIGTRFDHLLGGRVDTYRVTPFRYYPPASY